MTIGTIDNSQRTAARVAGISCLFSMAIVVFANYGLLNPLIVRGNVAETARNVVAHETQFRVTVVCFLAYSAGVFVLLTARAIIVFPGLGAMGMAYMMPMGLYEVGLGLWLLVKGIRTPSPLNS